MYQSAKVAFAAIDPNLEDVARTYGASEWTVFLRVTLPLSWTGLASGTLLSFARTLGEFGATLMIAGNIPGRTQTIPMAIYFATESGDLKTAGLYSLIISVVIFIAVYLLNKQKDI
jgi:molybdate transport system permease protein